MQRAMKIFISYARKDEAFRAQLLVFLTGMQRRGLIAPWHDRLIEGGSDWRADIRRELETCDLALLLVSAEFLASEFIHSEELTYLLKRRQEQGIRVVPLILRACPWRNEEIGSLAVLPQNGKPLITFDLENGERDQAWTDICEQIETWAKAFQAQHEVHRESDASASDPEAVWLEQMAEKGRDAPKACPDLEVLQASWPRGQPALDLQFCNATGVPVYFVGVGAEYVLRLRLHRAGNVLLFAQDDSGELHYLFPHFKHPEPWLEAGTYFLPGQLLRLPLPGQAGRKLVCGGKGRERACAFLLPQLPSDYKLRHLLSPQPLTTVSAFAWEQDLLMLRACIGTQMVMCEMVVG